MSLKDIANLDESCEEVSPPPYPFIDDEAEETDTEEEPPQDDEESDPNDCVVLAQLTEDEANAIDLDYLIDFDNWFSDAVFVNRINRAKKRRMEIVSESE